MRWELTSAVAFSAVTVAAAALAMDDGLDRAAGKALFDRNWVPAPASTDAADGLGPMYNARSCAACHQGGGAAKVEPGAAAPRSDILGLVVRLGSAHGAHDPYYGRQLQTSAVQGLDPEARVTVDLGGAAMSANGGRPKLAVALAGPPLEAGIAEELRAAPSLRGRGALESVPDAAILKLAAANAGNADGVRGRANIVTDANGKSVVGRYGWKAGFASLRDQVADAFALELGLSTPVRPEPYGDCTTAETACRSMPTGESAAFEGREVSGQMLDLVTSYVRGLPAPRLPDDAEGARLFASTGCSACHVPMLPGHGGEPVRAFTDLLLHDMGAGLDGGVGEPGVKSSEWRTAPLADLDPREGTRRYLHDGRAATLTEAVLWHQGEGAHARTAFEALPEADRRKLIEYLERL
jgi:CxxC motif-containing protein (DUF1111 family)